MKPAPLLIADDLSVEFTARGGAPLEAGRLGFAPSLSGGDCMG